MSDYMAMCLTHPKHGYYMTHQPIGKKSLRNRDGGDFITAPEINQMFGELVGIWCMNMWIELGKPSIFNLVEMGPGRGTLIKDLLRVGRTLPLFLSGIQIFLLEISPSLIQQQRLTLSNQTVPIQWIKDLMFLPLPSAPTIFIANEFLDTLAVKQWIKVGRYWIERAVGVINHKLSFVTGPSILDQALLPSNHARQPKGTIFETSPAREAIVDEIQTYISICSGAALFIDYGHLLPRFGNTFQAVRDHAYCDVFYNPGKSDLTSHVDFSALLSMIESVENLNQMHQIVTQSDFLLSLGLLERASRLGWNQDSVVQKSLQEAVTRLASPEDMGQLFKVLVLGSGIKLNSPRF
ncbi:class I SAM-dependent methyltransferase [Candidatus Endowatersipora endosymbiont of Watersipora subatra]|uniref:class I SAM-dependent methyltransferase n=1 Tax=Candidatus Endowatersipora endosymbiont of Watersipora subatra TaxID=3077946 RepID=UPI00312C99B1